MAIGFRTLLVSLAALGLVFTAAPGPAQANAPHGRCPECGVKVPACHLVERVVMVPMKVTETRMKTKVITNVVDREETYTVFQCVPRTRPLVKEVCRLKDDVVTEEVVQERCHLVMTPVEKTIKIQVPETEIHYEPVTKTICTPEGQVTVEETCPRKVTVTREELHTEVRHEPTLAISTTRKEISYCVKVPVVDEVPIGEEKYVELVPVEKTRIVQVCVPELIEVPVEQTVVRQVAKKVVCCESCAAKHGHGHDHGHGRGGRLLSLFGR